MIISFHYDGFDVFHIMFTKLMQWKQLDIFPIPISPLYRNGINILCHFEYCLVLNFRSDGYHFAELLVVLIKVCNSSTVVKCCHQD